MFDLLHQLSPAFILLLFGYFLCKVGLFPDDFRRGLDKLSYIILLPAMLIQLISSAEFHQDIIPTALALNAGIIVSLIVSILWALLQKIDKNTIGSIAQGASRFNVAMIMPIAILLFGDKGLIVVSLTIIFTVPLINVIVVSLLTYLGVGYFNLYKTVRSTVSNPLIVSILFGLLMNVLGWQIPKLFIPLFSSLKDAVVPLMLMSVGAAFSFRAITNIQPIIIATSVKFILYPIVAVSVGLLLGVANMNIYIIALHGFVPTAMSSYAISKQMGGDSQTMATIISVQTGLCLLTIPFSFAVLDWTLVYFGFV